MEPCLATTGADPTLPIVLAAALLVLGGVIAAVAIRRRKAGAALLVLALPFLVGASLLGSASPALAQPGVPCPTPTPTPTCEPEVAVDDLVIEGGPWQEAEGVIFTDIGEIDAAAYVSTVTAVLGIDGDATTSISAWGEQLGTVVNGPFPVDASDLGLDGTNFSITDPIFDEARGQLSSGDIVIQIVYTYDDGCGGELSTSITISAPFQIVA